MPRDLAKELLQLHGINPRVASTWDPTLPRERRLLVPIQVDGLAVRQAGGTWADCRMAEPGDGEDTPRSIDLLPDPFTDLDEPRPRGVYLHWAMPDSLLHLDGTADPEADPDVPALPDRWIVVRVWTAPGSLRRTRAAWVLDARTDGGPVALAAWRASTPDGLPITGLGTGDPGWSAYYDNTVNRFGFYDDLEGVTGSVSYLVCGWYADPAEDPIGGAGLTTWAGFHARLAELEWEADHIQPEDDRESGGRESEVVVAALHAGLPAKGAFLDADRQVVMRGHRARLDAKLLPDGWVFEARERGWPEQVLLHGSVVGIGWPNPLEGDGSEEVGGPPSADSIRVAFAPSGPEALGAVVAAESGRPRNADAVAALSIGTLPELDDESALARLDESLHKAAFDARRGTDGTIEQIWQSAATGPYQVPDPPKRSSGGGSLVHTSKKVMEAQPAATFSTTYRDHPKITDKRTLHDFLIRRTGAQRKDLDAEEQGEWVKVSRPGPRWYQPADPVIVVQGAKRSLKHGGDGRFSEDGRLCCRLSDQPVRSVSVRPAGGLKTERQLVFAEEILDRGLNHGAVPPACDTLLHELVILDPGSAPVIADRILERAGVSEVERTRTTRRQQATDVQTEQTSWWASYDPRVTKSGLVAHSGLGGTTPCPLALRPAHRPWVPMHLDWEVDYVPSDDGARDWTLDEIDLEHTGTLPSADASDNVRRLTGRCLLDPGLAEAAALTIRNANEAAARSGGTGDVPAGVVIAYQSKASRRLLGRIAAIDTGDELADIAQALQDMDVLGGALENFHERLRQDVSDEEAPDEIPEGFVPLRAGTLRLRRVRLVDAFGQVLWLAGSGPSDVPVDSERLIVAESATLPDAPGLLAAPPRFTAPTRLRFRWVRPDDPTADATPEHGPVCGWVLPDHLDGALEFFDASGEALGQLRLHPELGAAWELAPGRPSTVGGTPGAAIPQRQLAAIAQALVDRGLDDVSEHPGRETALAALLRVIDSTLWTVDPYGHVGEEHLSLLIGHPVAVLRAIVRLEVAEPVPDVGNEQVAVPIRLGALTHWKDGLFGYFVDNDFDHFRCVRSAAAELALDAPGNGFLGSVADARSYYEGFLNDLTAGNDPGSAVVHPYIDREGLLWIVPGQTHELTMLVEPHCVVHATTGLVPRKEIGLRRRWVEDALRTIAPTFRYGPVLRDPREVKMPIAAEVGGAWTWTHRSDVDVWAEEPVSHDGGDAILPPDPAVAEEGWLRLTPDQEADDG